MIPILKKYSNKIGTEEILKLVCLIKAINRVIAYIVGEVLRDSVTIDDHFKGVILYAHKPDHVP